MSDSECIGSCLIGETLMAVARQIHSFKCENMILEKNCVSTKIKALHGKKALCWIDKEIRESKISDEELGNIYKKVKVFIDSKFTTTSKIFEEKENSIEGEQLICESELATKNKKIKKMSGVSASHSGDFWEFNGGCCISWVDLEFKHLRDIKIKNSLP